VRFPPANLQLRRAQLVLMLATLLPMDGGRAQVFGVDVQQHPHVVRQLVGVTGQYASVDENLTGRENLWLFGRLLGLPSRKARAVADDLLGKFGLDDAGDKPISQFSGGMRRRLDLAASLITQPPLIFLDEPTTGLDPRTRGQMWETIRGLVRDGCTVLLTTQYLDEAEQLADRIAILHEGRILVDGTLAELKALLPPAKVEYVEKQPSLEDVFLTLVGRRSRTDDALPDAAAASSAALATEVSR